MKHFLLIEHRQIPSENEATLVLTDHEIETLPFSLIPSLAKTFEDKTVTQTPEGLTEELTETDSEALTEDTPEAVDTDATESLTEDTPEAVDTDATEVVTEITAEPSDDAITTAAPSVIILSDDPEILTEARARGIETLALPKRRFPLADTLLCLPLDCYETVALVVENEINDDPFTLFSDRRCLAVRLCDGSAPTYRTNFDLTATAVASSELLTALTAPEAAQPTAEKTTEPKAPFLHSLFEWIELFAVSLAAVLLVMTFFIRHSPVIGSSMSPTLHEGDVLLLTQVGYTPETGDIVIIQTDKDDLRRPLVKRVIATGGQTVRIDFVNWQIYLDGVLLKEDYLNSTDKTVAMECYSIARYFTAVAGETDVYEATVPEGHLFVLGDNRNNSKDSRDLGFIDERHIIGEVVYRLLPFSAMGDPT